MGYAVNKPLLSLQVCSRYENLFWFHARKESQYLNVPSVGFSVAVVQLRFVELHFGQQDAFLSLYQQQQQQQQILMSVNSESFFGNI